MTPRQSRQTAGQSLPDSLHNCLSLDIEVSRQSGQIVAAAACNPQTGQTWRARGPLTKQQLLELDRMAAETDHLVGHNILAFDLPRLRALHAGLGLLDMPALDTLHLNPLAFPAHPYHRLVKHYRDGGLIRTTHNDPLLDSQLTLQVLEAQLTTAAGERIARAAVGLALADRPRVGPSLRRLLRRGETASPTDARTGQRGAVALPRRECLPHRDPRADSHRRRVGLAGRLRDRLDVDGRHQLGHTALGAAATPRYRRPGEKAQRGELHRHRLHLVPRDERRGEGADPVVRLRLLPAHAGRPEGTVAAGTDHRGGPAGPECPRGAADRNRQVALLPGPRPVGLRQDQRPHGSDLPAGGTDGRPAGRA